jgi:HSP20 family protein
MANLIRRDDREAARASSPEYRWDPFRMVDALLQWDPARSDRSLAFGGSLFAPRFDVKETKDGYVIKADLPGVKDELVDVSLTGNQLTISGQREEEPRDEGEQYFMVERTHGSFARTFSLPDSVDSEHVTAVLKDGVLTLHIPKRPEAQPRRIGIRRADGRDGKA